jgi:hypothetical protein
VPADAAEVRRVTLTNNGTTSRDIQLTSYGEIVLAPPDADRAHPAFGNLFVETEYHDWCTAITATRRPRSGPCPPSRSRPFNPSWFGKTSRPRSLHRARRHRPARGRRAVTHGRPNNPCQTCRPRLSLPRSQQVR